MSTAREHRIADEVEKTLHAFDHDRVLEANPFLLTRIQAERESLHGRTRGFGFRLGLNQVLMLVVVVINLMTAVYWFAWGTKHDLQERLVAELRNDFQVEQFQNTY